jgi:hypothetical protein
MRPEHKEFSKKKRPKSFVCSIGIFMMEVTTRCRVKNVKSQEQNCRPKQFLRLDNFFAGKPTSDKNGLNPLECLRKKTYQKLSVATVLHQIGNVCQPKTVLRPA